MKPRPAIITDEMRVAAAREWLRRECVRTRPGQVDMYMAPFTTMGDRELLDAATRYAELSDAGAPFTVDDLDELLFDR